MATLTRFFLVPDDEVALFRFLGRFKLDVYPSRVPPGWQPFTADETHVGQLPEEDAYLAASSLGDVIVDKVKRGKGKGDWRVDEIRSPVIFYERCRLNDAGELVSGKFWAELDITPQTGRKNPAPDGLRRLYGEIQEHLKKVYRRSDPQGFWVGPQAARDAKAGLVLRDSEHRGGTVMPFR